MDVLFGGGLEGLLNVYLSGIFPQFEETFTPYGQKMWNKNVIIYWVSRIVCYNLDPFWQIFRQRKRKMGK